MDTSGNIPHPAENHLVRRVRIAQAIADEYIGRDLVWGTRDCAQMANAVVHALGRTSPLDGAHYASKRGAVRALHLKGFTDLADAVDQMGFKRIAPSMVLPCDILGFRPFVKVFGSALGVALSNGLCVAFVNSPLVGGLKAVVGKAPMAQCAWRVL
jgi:hypothetical protein